MGLKAFITRLIVISFLIIIPAIRADANDLTILTPPDHASIEGKLIDLVFTTGELRHDVIHVTINGAHIPATLNPRAKKTICLANLELSEGFNKISVSLLERGTPLAEKTITIFRRSDLSWKYNQVPPDFTPYTFHTRSNETKCKDCHGMDINSEASNPPSSKNSSCFLCHQQILTGKFVHGPASVWACLSCHDSKSPEAKFRIAQQTEALCADCHESDSWLSPAIPHGPVAMGMCTACHDPHAADYPFFLRMKTTDLCSACHEDTARRPHVITFFSSGQGHPVYRKNNPFRPGREFDCASCHESHGGAFPYILKNEYTSMRSYCTTCHEFNLHR